MSLEVESVDMIRLILQYLKESNLQKTADSLSEETGIVLNTVDNIDSFVHDITSGHWDTVLQICSSLKVPPKNLMDLYEQIAIELIEARELGAARSLIRQTTPMVLMKDSSPDRYMHLEGLLGKAQFDPREAYPTGSNREKRRAVIAQSLSQEVTVVPSSRLLALVGQALRWQQHSGLLPPGKAIDVFRGKAAARENEDEAPPSRSSKTIKFGAKNNCECALFSPDGQYLISGSTDGLIEVWNFMTGKLRKDLKYQSDDVDAPPPMMMDAAVISLCFSRDSEMLATGTVEGKVYVWKVQTGRCLRRFEAAHTKGIASIQFSRDNGQLLTGSFDNLARIHGLKSAKTLKEFRGHTSFVNTAIYSQDGRQVITGSSDGNLKIWSTKTTECLSTFNPKMQATATGLAIHRVMIWPRNVEQFIVCYKSNTACIMNTKGQVVKTFTNGIPENGDFNSFVVTPRGDFVYCTADDKKLYCFNTSSGELVKILETQTSVLGVNHHPHQNLVATFGENALLNLWKA